MNRCKSCGAEIEWHQTMKGKWIPQDINGVCHFETCPDAKYFRGMSSGKTIYPGEHPEQKQLTELTEKG